MLTLEQVAAIKASAKAARRGSQWAEAYEGYTKACELLEECAAQVALEGAADGDAAAARLGARRVAAEMQACRLSSALCAHQLQLWPEVISVCGEALKANPRCAAALHRRGLALEADGQLAAAEWDLKQALKLQPSNERHAEAAARVTAAAASKPVLSKGSLSGGADVGLDGMMEQMMAGLGGSGAGGAGGLGSLLSSLGDGAGAAGAGAEGLLGLLGNGLGGAKGGDDDKSPLEALLSSPLLAASGLGGKGTARMMGAVSRMLAAKRHMKRFYRKMKPFVPFLFWLAILLPLLLTFKEQLLAIAPWKWIEQYVYPALGLGAAAAAKAVGDASAEPLDATLTRSFA